MHNRVTQGKQGSAKEAHAGPEHNVFLVLHGQLLNMQEGCQLNLIPEREEGGTDIRSINHLLVGSLQYGLLLSLDLKLL